MQLFKKLVVKKHKKQGFMPQNWSNQFCLADKGQDWVLILLSRLLSYLVSALVIREQNVKEADLVV